MIRSTNLFLHKVYHQNKLIFGFFVSFLLFQAFFTYKGIETFPFINYGMYSAPVHSYEAGMLQIEVDGNLLILEEHPRIKADILYQKINAYAEAKKAAFKDPNVTLFQSRFEARLPQGLYDYLRVKLINNPEAYQVFPAWALAYLNKTLGSEYRQLKVYRLTYELSENAIVQKEMEEILSYHD